MGKANNKYTPEQTWEDIKNITLIKSMRLGEERKLNAKLSLSRKRYSPLFSSPDIFKACNIDNCMQQEVK